MPWIEHEHNEEVLDKNGNQNTLIRKIRKRLLKIQGQIISKDDIERLSLTGYFAGKSRKKDAMRKLPNEVVQMNGRTRSGKDG